MANFTGGLFSRFEEELDGDSGNPMKTKKKKKMLTKDGKPMSKAAIKRALRYTPLQRCYLDACKKIRTVVPDMAIVQELRTEKLVAELDHHDQPDVDALNKFMLQKLASDTLVGLDFSFGNSGSNKHTHTKAMSTQKSRLRLTRTISHMMNQGRYLKSLELFGLRLGIPEIEMLAVGFTNNKVCKRFMLRKSHIGDKPLARLGEALASAQVNVMSLIDNDLTDESASVITRVLKAHVTRRDEYMWTKSLRLQPGEGAEIQPHSIPIDALDGESESVVTQGLLAIDLSYNQFSDKTAHALAEHLKNDRYLLALTMRNCNVSVNGVNSIYQTLKKSPLSPIIMCQFDTTKITKTAGGKELLKEMDRLLTSHKSPPIMSFEPIKSCIKRRDDFKKILGLGAGNQGVEDFEEKDGEEKAEAGVELEEFVKFMDELSSNTGELSRTEFITAFRLLKREIAMCHDKIEGSRLTMQLFDILKKEFQEPERDKLVNTWISKITNATHHHVFEGRVSRLQLVREIKRLSERVPKFKLSSSNIIQLMRFIDVDGDDDLDRYEIEQAFNRASQRHYYEMLESHEQVLWLLEKHMKECRWSVPDLFRAIDADGSGALSLEEIAVKFAEWGFVDNSKLQQAKKEILAMYKARGKKRTAMLVDRKAKQTKDKLIRQSRSKANVRRNLNGEIEAPVVVKPAAMKPRPAKNVPVEASKDGSAPKVAIKFEDITDRMQIAMFCRHVDTPPIGNGDGTLSQMELQDAFRKMNQERAVALAQEAGMNAFGRLYDVIQSHYGELGQESVLRWFQEFDTSNAGRGDGRLSKNELRSAVRNLMELDRGFHMDEEELIKMLSFVDSSGDDDIGVDEIVRAEELLVAEENQPSAKELAIIRVFNKLKDFMHEKHWRVVDLFRHIDADDSSEISIKEFREALEKWNVLIDPMTTQELAATAGAEDPTTTPGTTGASNNWLDAEKPLAPLIVGDFLKIPQSFVDMVFTKPKLDGGVESVEKVTLTRLEEVVRYLRRLRDTEYARKSAEDLIKMLFEAVVKYRQACGFSADPSVAVDEWFQEIDVSQAGRGDGLITKVEFRDGIKKVELELERRRENGGRGIPDFYMSEKDLIDLIRYIDEDGNDDLDTKEIHAAFRRALQANDPTATAMKKCQDTLEKLEDTLSENGMMRIRDLFRDMCLSIEREEEKVRKQDPNAFPLNGVVKAVEVVPREFFERTLAEMGVIHVEGVSLRPRAKKTGPKLHKSVSSRLSDIRKEMAALPTTGLSEDIEESALERLEERFNQLWDKLERIEGQQGVESPVKRGGRPKLAAVDKATGRSTKSPSSTFRSSSAMESPITPGGPKSSDAELLQQLQTDLADRLKDIYKFS